MNVTLPIAAQEDSEDAWSFDWRKDPRIVCEEQPHSGFIKTRAASA